MSVRSEGRKVMHRSIVAASHALAMVLVIVVSCAPAARARVDGIATTSFPVPAMGCNFCHGGGLTPSVTLECVDCGGGPPAVAPLSVHEFKLTVVEIGAQDHAGLNVAAPDGVLSTGGSFAAGTQVIVNGGGDDEITHTAAKSASGGIVEFSFLWTAPAAPGIVTLAGWGNAVDDGGATDGDAADSVTLDVVVGDPPTPTATPEATATPTATEPAPSDCPASIDGGCVAGFSKGLLLVKENVPGRERLVAKFLKGPALAQIDMGNPLDVTQGGSGTEYALCIYDDSGDLAGGVEVDRAGDLCDGKLCWKSIGKAPNDPSGPGAGYRYKDKALASDGVLKVLYKGGDAGKSKALLVGKGSSLPPGVAAALQASEQVTVQLRSSDGICLSVDLAEIKKQELFYFKAK